MSPIDIALQLALLFFSIIIHEVAHGYVSYRLGDPTARDANRITLNPLAHIDLVGTIILPVLLVWSHSPVLLGWAKPVPFNPMYYRNIRKGIMTVGAAGPATNLALAAIAGLAMRILSPAGLAGSLLASACVMNVMLAVFNMIPIPPLDGSRVAFGLIPPRFLPAYMRLEKYGIFIIFGLLWTHWLDAILQPVSNAVLWVLLGS